MGNDRCIATSADSRYFPALIALLRSIKLTNAGLPVVVLDGGLTRRQLKIISRFAEVIPAAPFISIQGRGKFSYIGDSTLLKFETVDLPYEKVIHLDADMLVLEDISRLFDIPAGKIGVVEEVNSVKNMFRVQHRQKLMDEIDIRWDERGFNAGLFVLRPSEWRDLKHKAEDLINRFGSDVFSKTKDQQLLNIIFNGRTHAFPGRYNFSPFYDMPAEGPPAVIHFLSGCKPWHFRYPPGMFYDEFRAHIKMTEYPDIILIDLYRKYLRGKNDIRIKEDVREDII